MDKSLILRADQILATYTVSFDEFFYVAIVEKRQLQAAAISLDAINRMCRYSEKILRCLELQGPRTQLG